MQLMINLQCFLLYSTEDSGDALAMDLIFNGHTTLYNCNGDNYSEDVTEDKLKDV